MNPFASNNHKAIEEFYNKGRREFFRHPRVRNLDIELLEDIYSDSFRILIENIRNGKYKEQGSMAAYLQKTCLQQLLKQLRKMKRIETEPLTPMLSEVVGNYMDDEERETVLHIIEKLLKEMSNDICGRIFHLFYNEKKKMSEIAEIFQYNSEDVAKQRKSLCYKKFIIVLQDELKKAEIYWETKKERRRTTHEK